MELLNHRESFISTAVKDCKANKTSVWFCFIFKTSSPYAAQAVRLPIAHSLASDSQRLELHDPSLCA